MDNLAVAAEETDKRIIHGEALEFDEAEHMYTWGGKPVPGVTSILKVIGKPELTNWFIKVTRDYWLEAVKNGRTDFQAIHKESWSANKKISQSAADIGKNVHSYAECFFKGRELPKLETDQAKRSAEAFHKWIDSHHIKIKFSERRVFSREYFYAGTCDFIAEMDGVLGVGDIKTSSGIYPDMRFQTAAYQHALEEEEGIKYPVRWIVRFDKKTGDFEAKSFYDFRLDFQGFSSALTLHRTLQTIDTEKEKKRGKGD